MNTIISLKDDLNGVTSWDEAYIKIDSLLTESERKYASDLLSYIKLDSALIDRTGDILNTITRSMYKTSTYFAGLGELRVHRTEPTTRGSYFYYKTFENLSNPRVRFVLTKGFGRFYFNALRISLLPELPSNLLLLWPDLRKLIRDSPEASSFIIKHRSTAEEDFLNYELMNKILSWSTDFYSNKSPIQIAEHFIKDETKGLYERLSIVNRLIEICRTEWDYFEDSEERTVEDWVEETVEELKTEPISQKHYVMRIRQSLIKEIKTEHHLVGIPDSWITDAYSIKASPVDMIE